MHSILLAPGRSLVLLLLLLIEAITCLCLSNTGTSDRIRSLGTLRFGCGLRGWIARSWLIGGHGPRHDNRALVSLARPVTTGFIESLAYLILHNLLELLLVFFPLPAGERGTGWSRLVH